MCLSNSLYCPQEILVVIISILGKSKTEDGITDTVRRNGDGSQSQHLIQDHNPTGGGTVSTRNTSARHSSFRGTCTQLYPAGSESPT